MRACTDWVTEIVRDSSLLFLRKGCWSKVTELGSHVYLTMFYALLTELWRGRFLWKLRLAKCRIVGVTLLLFSRSAVSNSLWPRGLRHTRLLCPSLSPRVCSNLCPSSRGYFIAELSRDFNTLIELSLHDRTSRKLSLNLLMMRFITSSSERSTCRGAWSAPFSETHVALTLQVLALLTVLAPIISTGGIWGCASLFTARHVEETLPAHEPWATLSLSYFVSNWHTSLDTSLSVEWSCHDLLLMCRAWLLESQT